jgi:putative transposase
MAGNAAQEKKVNDLYAEIGRLTTQLKWLKKNLASTMTRAERVVLLERDSKEISLTAQAKLLSINRTSIYYKPVPSSEEEIAIKHRIDEIYTKWPFYGSRRITRLRRENMNVNRKRVQGYIMITQAQERQDNELANTLTFTIMTGHISPLAIKHRLKYTIQLACWNRLWTVPPCGQPKKRVDHRVWTTLSRCPH